MPVNPVEAADPVKAAIIPPADVAKDVCGSNINIIHTNNNKNNRPVRATSLKDAVEASAMDALGIPIVDIISSKTINAVCKGPDAGAVDGDSTVDSDSLAIEDVYGDANSGGTSPTTATGMPATAAGGSMSLDNEARTEAATCTGPILISLMPIIIITRDHQGPSHR